MNAARDWFFVRETPRGREIPAAAQAVGWVLVLGGFSLICWIVYVSTSYTWHWEPVADRRQMFLNGWWNTLRISAAALVLSLAFGLIVALLSRSPLVVLRCLSRFYVEIIRGTPLISQILLGYYLFSDALQTNDLARAVGLDSDAYVVGILLLSLFSGAYISEILRAGLESIGASQLESARAIGLSKWQTYRYVIFPQMFRQVLPPLTGQFANLIKDSSLLYIIAVREFTATAQNINALTYSTLESYIPLAIGYLLLTLPLFALSRTLENRFKFET